MDDLTYAIFIGPAATDPVPVRVPMAGVRVDAGFPSPAEDFMEEGIDLHEWLVTNQPATFYYLASGWSMEDIRASQGPGPRCLLAIDGSGS